MSALFKFTLLVAILAALTLWFGKGFTPDEKPIEPESSPLLNTIDAAHNAADQLGR